jgi:uncharacterized protein YciI
MLVALFYTPGPNWLPGKSVNEQPLQDHVAYMLKLHDQGKVAIAGPLVDNAGGLNVFHVETPEEAQEIMRNDPAIRAGICIGEAHPWFPLIVSGLPDANQVSPA